MAARVRSCMGPPCPREAAGLLFQTDGHIGIPHVEVSAGPGFLQERTCARPRRMAVAHGCAPTRDLLAERSRRVLFADRWTHRDSARRGEWRAEISAEAHLC